VASHAGRYLGAVAHYCRGSRCYFAHWTSGVGQLPSVTSHISPNSLPLQYPADVSVTPSPEKTCQCDLDLSLTFTSKHNAKGVGTNHSQFSSQPQGSLNWRPRRRGNWEHNPQPCRCIVSWLVSRMTRNPRALAVNSATFTTFLPIILPSRQLSRIWVWAVQ
jgi:hypothetical protein